MRRAFAAMFVGALFVALVATVASQTPQSAPLMVSGQKYFVVWDCGLDLQPNPCFTELLHVQGTRRDGWVMVQDDAGRDWLINPQRASAISIATPPRLASR